MPQRSPFQTILSPISHKLAQKGKDATCTEYSEYEDPHTVLHSPGADSLPAAGDPIYE